MLRPFGLSVPSSKISLISCFFRRVLSPLQRLSPQITMSVNGRQSWNVRLQESQENCFECYAGVHLRPHVTHTLGHTFLFHSCVSRVRTSHASALSPLVSSYSVCQPATMGFFTLMKGSGRNVCTFLKCSMTLQRVFHYVFPVSMVSRIAFQLYVIAP